MAKPGKAAAYAAELQRGGYKRGFGVFRVNAPFWWAREDLAYPTTPPQTTKGRLDGLPFVLVFTCLGRFSSPSQLDLLDGGNDQLHARGKVVGVVVEGRLVGLEEGLPGASAVGVGLAGD